jgi:hypothetical protein
MREKFLAENRTTAMSLHMDLSLKQLEEAVRIRRQMAGLEKRLASVFGTSSPARLARRGRRKVSAATRAKIAAAARARWARQKGRSSSTTATKKKKSGLTAAGRKRLSQLMKARWAARKKGKRKK